MSSDATCEESSVCKGAGYDEAFGSGDESEDFSPLSERETLAQSPDGDESSTEGGKDEVEEGRGENESDRDDVDVEGDDGDSDEESNGGTSEGPGDNRPFILPEDWAVNKFFPMMSDKVLRELRAPATKFRTISRSVSLERMRDVTQGESLTLACMMPCLLRV